MRYNDCNISNKSTPAINKLYTFTMFGWSIWINFLLYLYKRLLVINGTIDAKFEANWTVFLSSIRVYIWIFINKCFQFLITYISSVSLKLGACYIAGQWGDFRVKNATLCSHILLWHFFVVFHQKTLFLSFSLLFLMKYQILINRILIIRKRELIIRNSVSR